MSGWTIAAAFVVALVIACWPTAHHLVAAYRSPRWPVWRVVLFFGYGGVGAILLPLAVAAGSLRAAGRLIYFVGQVGWAPIDELLAVFRALNLSDEGRETVMRVWPRRAALRRATMPEAGR